MSRWNAEENHPTGFGSVSGVPELPKGFADAFESRLVNVGDLKLHAVIGGSGKPLLLLGGWPQTWYAWRLVMPGLARHFKIIAVDPRGVGLSDQPRDGYDLATLAQDMVRLMTSLGHSRFAMVGHDIGMWTGYALASDHPGSLARLAVLDATTPGVSPSPPLLGSRLMSDRLWHFNFNRVHGINEQLISGREDIYFGYQFATKAATPHSLPDYAVQHYVDTLKASPEALRASFEFYRAIDQDLEQNAVRRKTKLTMPVLAVGGAASVAAGVEKEMRLVADDVTGVVLPDCGHYVPEEAPDALLHALMPFLSPYHDGNF
jgi:pimeloyl-ACP methyl ester carboxylesterase